MLLIKTMALEKFPNPTHTVVNDKQLTRRGKSMYDGICIAGWKLNTNTRYFFLQKNIYCKIKNYDIKNMHVLTKAVQNCQIFNYASIISQ